MTEKSEPRQKHVSCCLAAAMSGPAKQKPRTVTMAEQNGEGTLLLKSLSPFIVMSATNTTTNQTILVSCVKFRLFFRPYVTQP
jgi:hypothetical protein